MYHSTLGWKVIKKKKKTRMVWAFPGSVAGRVAGRRFGVVLMIGGAGVPRS